MDASGTGIFESDDAADWLDELCTSDGTDLLSEAFSATGRLNVPDGTRILCAGAALAVALGHEIAGAPDLLKIWAAGLFDDDVRALLPDARAALQRVSADDSELKDLWQKGDAGYADWEQQAQSLIALLRN